MRSSVAAIIAILAVLAAVGIGLASSRLFAPTPTPIHVNVTFTPTPSPIPTPYDEAALFRLPLSDGCATNGGVWLVTNGGGLLRYDGAQWAANTVAYNPAIGLTLKNELWSPPEGIKGSPTLNLSYVNNAKLSTAYLKNP